MSERTRACLREIIGINWRRQETHVTPCLKQPYKVLYKRHLANARPWPVDTIRSVDQVEGCVLCVRGSKDHQIVSIHNRGKDLVVFLWKRVGYTYIT